MGKRIRIMIAGFWVYGTLFFLCSICLTTYIGAEALVLELGAHYAEATTLSMLGAKEIIL